MRSQPHHCPSLPQTALSIFNLRGVKPSSKEWARNGHHTISTTSPSSLLIIAPSPNPSFLSIQIKVANSWGRSGGALHANNVCAPDQPQLLCPSFPGFPRVDWLQEPDQDAKMKSRKRERMMVGEEHLTVLFKPRGFPGSVC